MSIIHLPLGETVLTETLRLPPGTLLKGAGVGLSFVRVADDFPHVAHIETTDPGWFGIEGFTLDGNCAHVDPSKGIGIWLHASTPGSFVRGVMVRNTSRSGIFLGDVWGGMCQGTHVDRNNLWQCGRPDAPTHSDNMGIAIVNAIDIVVHGNIINDSPMAFDLEQHPQADDRLWNILLDGNLVRTSHAMPSGWLLNVLGQPNGREARQIRFQNNQAWGPPEGKATTFEHYRDLYIDGKKVE